MVKLLQFAKKSDPVLRKILAPVQDFKDPALHETIEDMCYSILPEQLKAAHGAHESAAGMAANQWGIEKRIFIYTPEGSQPEKKRGVMINPSYTPYLRHKETTPEMSAAYEGCFSIPLTTGLINRYECILAVYYTPKGKKKEMILQGWEARVFQHETDHLNGKLFDGTCDGFQGPECLERVIFKDKAEMEKFWEDTVRPSREE